MTEHLTPTRRASDPPEGSRAARWADVLRPWQALLTAVLLVWSVGATFVAAIGFQVRTPREVVDANSARIVALDSAAREDRARLDRLDALVTALTQSKCLELDAGSQALSVLPCRRLGVQTPRAGTASRMSLPSLVPGWTEPDWDTLMLRSSVATTGGYRP